MLVYKIYNMCAVNLPSVVDSLFYHLLLNGKKWCTYLTADNLYFLYRLESTMFEFDFLKFLLPKLIFMNIAQIIFSNFNIISIYKQHLSKIYTYYWHGNWKNGNIVEVDNSLYRMSINKIDTRNIRWEFISGLLYDVDTRFTTP